MMGACNAYEQVEQRKNTFDIDNLTPDLLLPDSA